MLDSACDSERGWVAEEAHLLLALSTLPLTRRQTVLVRVAIAFRRSVIRFTRHIEALDFDAREPGEGGVKGVAHRDQQLEDEARDRVFGVDHAESRAVLSIRLAGCLVDVLSELRDIGEVINRARDEAAERMKEEYDARHEERKFEVGDRVWWREHEPSSKLAPKRSGPYEVHKVLSDLNYELAELPEGPKIGRRHKIVHVQHIEKFEVVGGEAEELVVEVMKHKRNKKKVQYLTRFTSGEKLWLTEKELIDKEQDGYVINDALKAYWEKTPKLKPWFERYLG